ncbi:uncharacterized protein LOC116842057 [Odontomachus brunneus]|uniref:uncharacterized protein LOC116842057 n=1 Tax=Odontomachus brunneus TaxID=486640 RepID=UPI0013F18268|nr:uncharacterized protein LOC116842057 [Odontomachus brunneus]
MSIPYIFLVCSIIVELCFGQYIDPNVIKDYLRNVQNVVSEKVGAYGLSNLPDVDVKISYNIIDGNSYDIKGWLYLEDGFVMDIENINLIDRSATHTIFGNGAVSVETIIKFENMSFVRDFRFEADEPEKIPDRTIGSVIIKPESFYFSVKIIHDLRKDTLNCTMSTSFQGRASKEAFNFYPKNTLTSRLRKSLSYAVPMFPDIGISWQRIFEPILNNVIKIVPFPDVDFPVSRN